MSDGPQTGKHGLGVQAYRWLVAIGMGFLVLLSQRTLSTLDEAVSSVRDLRAQVMTMQGTSDSRFNAHAQRLDAQDRRNDAQDVKLDSQWQQIWQRATPRATP